MEVDSWVRRSASILEDSLRTAERVGIVLPPTPDGIASSVILSEICYQLGVDSEFLVSLPETSLDAIELLFSKCDYLVFLELPPHGRGPMSVARKFYKGIALIDHGSTELWDFGFLRRITFHTESVSVSLLLYLISSVLSRENEYLSWVAVSGFKPKCSSRLCDSVREKSQFYWPDLMEEDAIDLMHRMLSAACFEGEEWVLMAISSLQESIDDPWWFIRGSSITSNILRSKVSDFEERVRELFEEPLLIENSIGIWEVNEPHQRFVFSLKAREYTKAAISFYYDPPLGLVYASTPPNVDLYRETVSMLKGESEWSAFGGMGFLSMIINSETMFSVIMRLKDRLSDLVV